MKCHAFPLVLVLLASGSMAAYSHSGPPAQATGGKASVALTERRDSKPGPAPQRYTLPPERRAKAIAYSRARYILYFAGVGVSLGIFFLLWQARITVTFGNWAHGASPRLFVQCLVFVPLVVAVFSLIEFPLEYYSGFALERRFDLSTRGFGSWLADWAKNIAITTVVGILVVWILYRVIRRSPRRWWLYFWLATVPLTLGFMWIEPVIIDPLFFKFTPLDRTQPWLTARIEEMLHHAGLAIPRSRIFEMDASTKTKTLDAYVTGVGASRRVVVWDNTLRRLDQDETLLVLGHETGHYVLHHIPKQFALIELIMSSLSYATFVCAGKILNRAGPRAAVAIGDLASLPIIAFILTLFSFFSSPLINGISRHYERQADQFGLEVAYGVVSDPNSAEARSLQVLGEEDLADPDPNPFIKCWLYSHPPLDERIRFATHYKPWAEGKPLEFLPRQP